MKIPKPEELIKKSLNYSKKYIATLLMVCFCVSLVFTVYVTFDETKRRNEIVTTINKCGDYDYVQNIVDHKELENIEKCSDIKDYREVILSDSKINNRPIIIQWLNDRDLQYTDIKLNAGRFPEKVDEILVERWLLTIMGIPSEESIGKQIEVWNNQTCEYESKKITGIVTTAKSGEQQELADTGYPIVIANSDFCTIDKSDRFYNVYIRLKEHKDALSKVELLNKEGHNATLHDELYYVRGYLDTAVYEKIFENTVFILTIFILLAFVCLCIKNVVDLCMHRWAKEMAIYKSIGVNLKLIRKVVVKKIGIILFVASFAGSVVGIISVYIFNYYSTKKLIRRNQIVLHIPYKYLLIMTAIILVMAGIIVFLAFDSLGNQYFCEYIVSVEKGMAKKTAIYGTLYKNERIPLIKFAIRNFAFYKWRKISACFCIAASVTIISVLSVGLEAEKKIKDDNNFDFFVRYDTDTYYDETGDIHKELKDIDVQIKSVLDENKISYVYAESAYSTDMKFHKKYLTDEFKKKLNKDVVKMLELEEKTDYITYSVNVVGYSEKMLDEMQKEGLTSIERLEDNEAIFLNRTINRDNTVSVKLNVPVGEKYEFLGYGCDRFELKIVGEATGVLSYPEIDDNYFVIIVNEKTFNKYYNKSQIYNFFYNSSDKNVNKKIEQILAGVDKVKLIDLQYEKNQKKVEKRQAYIFYVITFVTFVLLMFISIIMFSMLEIDMRTKEYNLLHMLGVSIETLRKISCIETIITFGVGCGFGIIFAKSCVEYLYDNMLLIGSEIRSGVYGVGIISVCLCIGLINYLTGKKLQNLKYPIE